MSNQTNEELAFAYQAGDRAALLPLWTQVEKLARLMIRRYLGLARRNCAIDYDDLLQAAFLGVARAASVYRSDAGAFSTVMQRYIQNECRALLGLRGRVKKEHYDAVSASTPISEEGDATILDTVADESLPDADAVLIQEDITLAVRGAVDKLPPEHAAVIRGHYLEGHPLAVLADRMGVTVAEATKARREGRGALRIDRRLQDLMYDVPVPFRYKGVTAFNQDWTSSTEDAALKLIDGRWRG